MRGMRMSEGSLGSILCTFCSCLGLVWWGWVRVALVLGTGVKHVEEKEILSSDLN